MMHIFLKGVRRGRQKLQRRWQTNDPSAQTGQGLVGANYPTSPCER